MIHTLKLRQLIDSCNKFYFIEFSYQLAIWQYCIRSLQQFWTGFWKDCKISPPDTILDKDLAICFRLLYWPPGFALVIIWANGSTLLMGLSWTGNDFSTQLPPNWVPCKKPFFSLPNCTFVNSLIVYLTSKVSALWSQS